MAAIQPSDRPAGSRHVLRFTGALKQSALNLGAYTAPGIEQSSYPANAAAALTPFRFLLADSTNLANLERQFPAAVFDDHEPAGSAPHAPVLDGATKGILNATDLNITARTWCQNLKISVTPRTATALADWNSWDPAATRVCLDVGATSGMGTDTGLPVVVIGIVFAADVPASIDFDVVIEIPHTAGR